MDKKDCTYIYKEEMNKNLNTLKRFREAWLEKPLTGFDYLFNYGEPDFYFYRYTVSCQERETDSMLINILYRVMAEYGLSFEVPDEIKDAPFVFIVCEGNKRVGFRLSGFHEDDDENAILRRYNVNEVYILKKMKSGKAERWIAIENNQYREEGKKQRAILLENFFDNYFGKDEYNSFLACLDQYLKDTRDITGLQTIKFLSWMNLAAQKVYEEKVLLDWNYKDYRYQIFDLENEKIQNYRYLQEASLPSDVAAIMENRYIKGSLFKTMLGINEYAESFMTSEWLFHSLKEKKNFDYTSVISGYLKSIEQLLYTIVMLNIDNGCKIAMSKAEKIQEEVKEKGITTYIYKKKNDEWIVKPSAKYLYIDFTSDQEKYMDSSIGTFEYFLRNNRQILVDKSLSGFISDMVSCFRTECRNGYFHTHNLSDWKMVEKTRSNAIYLYFVLLGACIFPSEKEMELGIVKGDEFDALCKKIRGLKHQTLDFIFEYSDGRRVKVMNDVINNTVEYTDDGVEHYSQLVFFEVNDFTLEECERIDADIENAKRVYLTRDNLPCRIFGVRKGELTEVFG